MNSILKLFLKIVLLNILLITSSLSHSSEWTKINKCAERAMEGDFINIIKINSKCPELKIIGSSYEDKGMTTLEFANKYQTDIAINANYSKHDIENTVIGQVMTNGKLWPGSHDSENETMFYCDTDNKCDIESISTKSKAPKNATLIISGWQALKNGRFECPRKSVSACYLHNGGKRHPRSVIGIGEDMNIYLFSIDGRLSNFEGATLTELSEIMNKFSISRAVNLDGGGSTTLVVNGKRINKLPNNQKIERVVPNHIGFIIN